MTHPDDIPTRVTHLEQEMIHARRDAAAARVLAGGADRDVSQMQQELRAHTRTLNALRETQVEHGQRLDRVERKVDKGFEQADANFKQVDANFKQVDANFKQVDANFKRVDANFKRVDANFVQIGAHFRQIDENFRTIEGKFSTVNTGIAHITALLTNKVNESDEE